MQLKTWENTGAPRTCYVVVLALSLLI